ncbi:bifunctional precorrin-2 dehydrogenase/sirohydrochlorin ferrochelatase [Natroniella sulfidigena]|uniref:precorrin-2 dehydrogenase/sirohydrochlorin ferrochelatase family protein n=1 Tax=Natroniella sulfidigena TaxID=723921 RepID=UPI00200B5FAB|nr:bifunctional precorrin-2 dehydrogenase/sirohydrochlorin ferrochelatase [Natroniella sulfidigena]MCK8815860.1 bifunctional precorrin-2 dehydrogenase/sirohydrochlorin ferrochelatase [Natroniella sulfidigena]
MELYPVNLRLKNQKVLIVGGGKVAYRKLKRLVTTEAKIELVSPKVIDPVKELIKQEEINYKQREFLELDLESSFLVIAATDQSGLNQRIAQLAEQEGILANVIDNLELSTCTLPAVVERGDLLITIATNGSLPALSRQLRLKLEEEFGPEFAFFLELLAEIRPLVIDKIDQEEQRREIFRRLADLELIEQLGVDRSVGIEEIKQILPEQVINELELI